MTDRDRRTQLGRTGPSVFPIALGCMAMSGAYGPSDDAESVATIREAIDRGITLLDTGDFYGMGHNELLIRRAIEGQRGKVQLSVKFGALRGPDSSWLGYDARPAATIGRFHAFAAEFGMTPAQLSLAWVLAKQPDFVPVVGAKAQKQLHDVLGALEKTLSSADAVALEAIVPNEAIEGTRYGTDQMKHLDSER
jgi:aryl-alcohol dehydrogenase-like predicted oxidoreductase